MTEEKKQTACCCGCGGESSEDRRSFCKTVVALGVGAAAVAAPIYGGARMALYPLQQEGLSGKEYALTTLDNLDETPRQYSIVDTIRDAWMSEANQVIGNIFIRKIKKADGSFGVEAFQTVCPHAGCRIKVGTQKNPKSGKEEPMFYCPCHGDMFTFDGKRIDPGTSKSARDMDSLEARVDPSGKVFVKFQNFRLGDSQKAPV